MTGGRPSSGHDLDAERLDPLVCLEKANAEIAIVIGTLSFRVALGRIGETTGTIKLESAVSGREGDANADEEGIGSATIVFGRLLGAVADAVHAGALHKL